MTEKTSSTSGDLMRPGERRFVRSGVLLTGALLWSLAITASRSGWPSGESGLWFSAIVTLFLGWTWWASGI